MSEVKYRLEVWETIGTACYATYDGNSPFMTFVRGDVFLPPIHGKQALPSNNQFIAKICHKLEHPENGPIVHTILLELAPYDPSYMKSEKAVTPMISGE